MCVFSHLYGFEADTAGRISEVSVLMARLNYRHVTPVASTEHETPAGIYSATKVMNEKCLKSMLA